MSKRIFLLIIIVTFLLGAFLRFYQLDKVPGSLEWDEVSIGYNAYSVLQTGKDEYGEFLPTAFRAFGEYKQPVYIYLDVASIAVFGLNDFAVRFPSAFFGSLSIFFVYLFTSELFRKYPFARQISLLSMLFFAISPWSIQFSRAAFEANVALSFVIAGAWLFLRGLHQKRNWYFFASVFLLALSTYTYISAKLFVPILFVALLLYGVSYFKKRKRLVLGLVALLFIISTLWLLDPKSVSRSGGVIFTNQQTEILDTSIQQMDYDIKQGDSFGTLLHNRRIVYASTVIENYLSHFNPLWLFFTGDEVNRHHAPNFGNLYLVSLPFILAGIYFLLSRALTTSWPLFVWFLAAPLASSLTFEAPHALRSLIFLPTWHIFEAAGVIFFLSSLRRGWLLKLGIATVTGFYVLNSIFYLHQYFVHTNTDFQKDWQYGYKEAIEAVDKYASENERIIFSKNFEQPHIFYLYYNHYDPVKYVAEGGSSRTSEKCYSIDNAYFGDCTDQLRIGDIYVVLEEATITDTEELEGFTYQNGDPATRIYEYQ